MALKNQNGDEFEGSVVLGRRYISSSSCDTSNHRRLSFCFKEKSAFKVEEYLMIVNSQRFGFQRCENNVCFIAECYYIFPFDANIADVENGIMKEERWAQPWIGWDNDWDRLFDPVSFRVDDKEKIYGFCCNNMFASQAHWREGHPLLLLFGASMSLWCVCVCVLCFL